MYSQIHRTEGFEKQSINPLSSYLNVSAYAFKKAPVSKNGNEMNHFSSDIKGIPNALQVPTVFLVAGEHKIISWM